MKDIRKAEGSSISEIHKMLTICKNSVSKCTDLWSDLFGVLYKLIYSDNGMPLDLVRSLILVAT